MRTVLIALKLSLLLASGQAEETPSHATDWASLEINLSSLETWGTKHYSYSVREPGETEMKTLGSSSITTEITDNLIILRDRHSIRYRGEDLRLEMIHTCRKDNFLSPTRIESQGTGSDEVHSFIATVNQGKATVRVKGGREGAFDIPEGTITNAAIFRLVTLVPGTPGRSYSFEYWLESSELNLKKKYSLTAMQPESIPVENRQVECSKFELTGGGIRPAYYWVSKEGVLQRLMMDDRKIVELIDAP